MYQFPNLFHMFCEMWITTHSLKYSSYFYDFQNNVAAKGTQ